MKIENDDELFNEIDKILTSVQSKTRANQEASVYQDLYQKLIAIQNNVENGDFSLESKKNSEMSGPLACLYSENCTLPKLGESLYAINDYYQGGLIETLGDDAEKYFLYKK